MGHHRCAHNKYTKLNSSIYQFIYVTMHFCCRSLWYVLSGTVEIRMNIRLNLTAVKL